MTQAHIGERTPGIGNPAITAGLLLWALVVAGLGISEVYLHLPLPVFGISVALLTAGLVLGYLGSPRWRRTARRLGLRRLTAVHVWRIAAAFAFFAYGAQGLLPERFVFNAGWGDLLAGVLALGVVLFWARSRSAYWVFHIIGLADFFLAVGTGLLFSILSVPTMETIAVFPMAFIPLFGVVLSAVTHVMAFDILLLGDDRAVS